MTGTERPILFQRVPLEKSPRIALRPLREVSRFVVEDFPVLLRSVDSGLESISTVQDKVERQLADSDVDSLIANLSLPDRKVARLDLLMLDSGIVHQRGTPPDRLSRLIEFFSRDMDMVNGLTYEDILNNPTADIRTFTTGRIGRSEADFWIGHNRTEVHLAQNIRNLRQMIQLLNVRDYDSFTESMSQVISGLRKATKIAYEIGFHMPRRHFSSKSGFRRYVMKHPIQNLEGPSGAHSATIPMHEALIAGECVPPAARHRVQDKLSYYAVDARPTLQTMYEEADAGGSIRQLLIRHKVPPHVKRRYNEMARGLRNFRTTHFKGVAHQLQSVFKGEAEGTSGETNVPAFLRQLIDINMEIE